MQKQGHGQVHARLPGFAVGMCVTWLMSSFAQPAEGTQQGLAFEEWQEACVAGAQRVERGGGGGVETGAGSGVAGKGLCLMQVG